MSKPKYKIGDRVIVKRKAVFYCVPERCIGKEGIITRLCGGNAVEVKIPGEETEWTYHTSAIELIKPEKIIIYRNGSQVIAKNTATGKTGVASCNPADEFDFETGAKLAFERLTNPEPEKPKLYNGKVVCVSAFDSLFTKGKIYEVKDGNLCSNNDFTYRFFLSVDDINRTLDYQFIELIED